MTWDGKNRLTKKATDHAVRMFLTGFSVNTVVKSLRDEGAQGIRGPVMRFEVEHVLREHMRRQRRKQRAARTGDVLT